MNTLVLINLLILALASTISADLTAPTRNYNVTSPVTNGPYVVDQFLPCTYRLMGNVDSSSLHLQIILKPIQSASSPGAATASGSGAAADASAPPSAVAPIAVSSPTSSVSGGSVGNSTSSTQQQQPIVITDNADVSKTEASAKHEGNTTYYEHSINYKIPLTVKPGRYNVVFFDTSTNTELPVPIEIRSVAVPASPTAGSGSKASGGSLNGSTSDGHSQSIFAGGAAAPAAGAKTAAALPLLVSLVVFMFLRI